MLPHKILIIDDENDIASLMLEYLRMEGYDKVDRASNGLEGLEKYKTLSPDLVLMDIEMPVMGGMEATGKIISYERSKHKKHTPIVALTANALSGDREKYIGAGMDAYLSKPIELEALNNLLIDHFEERIVEGLG